MLELAVAGSEEFLLGFQLAGIRHTFLLGDKPLDDLLEIRKNQKIGVLVLEEETMHKLPDHVKSDMNKSIRPVIVLLSKEGEGSDLRDKIISAIGVDLWKG